MKYFAALLTLVLLSAQSARIASDFEIAQTEKELTTTHSYVAQLSGRLNLGDLRLARGERTLARSQYTRAYDLAAQQRVSARRGANLTQYATATMYAGLAQAKLGNARDAFTLLEESLRYTSSDAQTWNVYATAMSLLGKPAKAIAAERNAVSIGEHEPDTLDLAVYRYALATYLGDSAESEQLLHATIETLQSPAFDEIRRDIARKESFETYSTARGDEAAYLSTLQRAQLRLAMLYESRGDTARARATYESVLRTRNDEPAALAALARLSRKESDYAAAFDADPFSPGLIRDYQRFIRQSPATTIAEDTPGALMRRAIRGDRRAVAQLEERYPNSDVVRTLAAPPPSPAWLRSASATAITPTPDELRALLAHELTPAERQLLDAQTFTAAVTFDASPAAAAPGQTVFESGTIGDVRIRFSEPTAFAGTFAPNAPLRLTFRIAGASDDALLVDPLRLEAAR